MLRDITQKIHNVRRLRQILQVFAKHGFGYIVDRLHIEQNVIGKKVINIKPIRKLDVFDQTVAVRARKVLEELGPTFIKLGQILSTRADLIPVEFCKEFEKLQDRVPSFEYEKVEEQISGEFKRSVSKIYKKFSPEPIAAASLAQVHIAELESGQKVIVKVQRPGIKKIITTDLEILYGLSKLAEKYIEESRIYNPVGVVDEFRKTILKEIDFNREARNIDTLRRNFKDDDTVHTPAVFHNLSTKKVLTIEKIDGIKISNVDKIDESGLDRKQLAINGAGAVLKQIFVDGFFHADPHPGNIFAIEGNKIVFLDCGMMGRIDEETKDQIAAILAAFIERDVFEMAQVIMIVGSVDEADVKGLNADITELMENYYGISLEELKIGKFLTEMMDIISQNRIKIPPDLFLLAKALITIEGIGRKLDPDFNMVARTKPFMEKLIKQRYSPKRIAREIKRLARGFYAFTSSLPRDLSLVLGKMKKGTLVVEFEHKGLENLILQMDKVSNRIAFSVIIASLIVGSSIIMQTNKGPLFLGFPVLGILGFLVAGLMGLWLAIAILRSGRL
ncbi:MAG: ubiquinone biosynthesis protein UbiB [Candidatus Omnitrophica bacterium]|nr:ubiquinone biosynthesis protein UbiB [Candidatus Omnitrophota bacterium]